MLFGTNLLNPVFLQEFMGYTAWKAGLVLAPRAAAASRDARDRAARAARKSIPARGRARLFVLRACALADGALEPPGRLLHVVVADSF